MYPFLFPQARLRKCSLSFLSWSVMPRQDARFTVVEGASNAALRNGRWHLEGSPLPGASRHTLFRVLKDVLIGDEIRIDRANDALTYRIVDVRIVSPIPGPSSADGTDDHPHHLLSLLLSRTRSNEICGPRETNFSLIKPADGFQELQQQDRNSLAPAQWAQ